MKKISMILMAFALAITMSQCKKNEGQPTSNDEVVTITLDVKQNNGSKVVVNPNTGTVDFETGDKIYVGSGGKYVGFLTHNGTNFSGNITNPIENQPLQFYFLGNVTPQETLSAGTTEECSVIISDQTEHLPVISCAASNENYVSGVTAYSAHLLNKCALVKFNVTTPSNSPICITGMKNKVTVDFTQNTMIPSQDGDGVIMLPAGSGENVEKWAILLPQEALEEGGEGSVYSEDGNYLGIRPNISAISENDYLGEGIAISISNFSIQGAINGLFTINAYGDQAYFSQGNLQYQASTSTWRFANNQFEYIGESNSNISPTYDGWIDLFGWGTRNNPTQTSTNDSDYPSFQEWGTARISNGGNTYNQWHTLSDEEWSYVLNTRQTTSGIRYVKARVNYVKGVILLPDDWNPVYYTLNNINQNNVDFSSNVINDIAQWNNIEQHGAVFLPTAGARDGTTVYNLDYAGNYWSASFYQYNNIGDYARHMSFSSSSLGTYNNYRYRGLSVRLVQDYNQ